MPERNQLTVPEKWRSLIGTGIWLVAYVVAAGAFVLLRDLSIFLALLAIFAIAGTAVSLHRWVRRRMATSSLSFPRRVLVVLPLPIIGAVIVAFWLLGVADSWGFFGFAVLYLGLGLLVEQLREQRWFTSRWGLGLLALAGVVALVGLVAMAISGAAWTTLAFAIGLLAAPVGLSLVSAIANRFLEQRDGQWLWMLTVGGGVAFVAGLIIMAAVFHVDATYVLLLAGLMLVFMLAIAARSNADVVIFIALAAAAWTLTSRTVPLSDALKVDPGDHVVVALGDSYISGEGADAFYEGTNNKGGNECRRAPTAYPALLVLDRHADVPGKLAFVACSGAKTYDIADQLDELDRMQADVDLVLLMIGGNDALFGSVGQTCLLAGNCSAIGTAWTDNLTDVGNKLRTTYDEVRQRIPTAPVLVVPYPIPIAEQGCNYSPLSDDEHRLLHDYTAALDATIISAANDKGFYVVDSMPTAFAGQRLCDVSLGDAAVNFFAANSVRGTLEQSINPTNWFHNSLHPNERGHEVMRTVIGQWLDDHPNLTTTAPPTIVPAAPASASAGTTCVGNVGKDLERCTDGWSRQQDGRFLLTKGLLLLVIAFGAWVLALVLIQLWRAVYPDEGPIPRASSE